MTIHKNSKRAKEIIARANNIRVYSLSNSFSGTPLTAEPVIWGGPMENGRFTRLVPVSQAEFLRHELESRGAKLTADPGYYILHIHSNLWYEFAA